MRVEWRRELPNEPGSAEAGNAALAESIRAEIGARGPITFARFMQHALYDPNGGYYATAATRPTRSGDFLTAPELHPIFGRTLAATLDEMWRRLDRPSEFAIREYGAGSGTLFLAILDGLVRAGSELAGSLRYQPVDLTAQQALIAARVAEAGHLDRLEATPGDAPFVGVALANEFLDALPVHRVIQLNGVLREIHVDWRDGAFVEVAGPLTDGRLASWFTDAGVTLAEGQRAEVNLQMLDWLAALATQVERGYGLVIDYGSEADRLYDQTHPNGTIRAFSGQRVSSDVLGGVGERDITSSVDFDALERGARACGFNVVGRRRSNEFLLACGLDETYAQARAETDNDWEASLTLRSAVARLLDPNALGGYQVSILARHAPAEAPLVGLQPLSRTR